MNEPVNQNEKDRNHSDPVVCETAHQPKFAEMRTVNHKPHKMLQFYPLPTQMIECRKRGYKMTAEKNYPVLEEKEVGEYREKRLNIKTIDDSGKELWINDEYFIPANQVLAFEKDCGWNIETKFDTKLVWDSADIPVLRRVSFNDATKNVHVENDKQSLENWEKYKSEIASEIKVLSGVQKSWETVPECANDSEIQKIYAENVKFANEKANKKFARSKKKAEEFKNPYGNEGENPLLNNLDKLWECMGTVFPDYRQVDTDGLLEYVKANLHRRKIEWIDGSLQVDGAKTNIMKKDVDATFNGLKNLTSPKAADKIVGKVIVNKLKKLF